MTEQEWLASVDPQAMLAWLTADKGPSGYYVRHNGGRPLGDRKLRLFACACCRAVWHSLTYPASRNAVEVAERFADGEATERQMTGAGGACNKALYPYLSPSTRTAKDAAETAAWAVAHIRGHVGVEPIAGAVKHTRIAGVSAVIQAALLRDIAGNPWRPMLASEQCLLQACLVDSPVAAVARTIYEERAFEQLPILADALEEAGCADADILAHCRVSGPHVRGCWVLDLLLGKE